jgi:amino acid adenylation domain-containing protein
MTYCALNAQANRIAHALIAAGVRPGARVAICAARGPALVAGLLGVMKSGAAYVPLDPAYPPDRLATMLADSAPAALLTQAALAPGLGAALPRVLLDDTAALSARQDTDPCLPARAGQVAYVIHTSGSTGKPKGVMVSHGGVLNLLAAMGRALGATAHERVLSLTTIGFDIAALELYLPLTTGGTVLLVGRATSADGAALGAALTQLAPTLVQATPSTWRMVLDSGWPGAPALKAICGGEALPADLARRLHERVGALWNAYGPTETTIWSTLARYAPGLEGQGGVVPVGAPLDNTQVYLLDDEGRLVPPGVAGEICIGGAGVAHGYWNRPGLSAERFGADPFGGAAGGRIYRTGDLGRWRSDGMLDYLGRNDFQIKLRGHRVEPGEIEQALQQHDAVAQAVVVARPDNAGQLRLVAYLVPRGGASCDAAALRAALAAILPEHMVPAAFVSLAQFPLTANGKLDRLALPAPDHASFAARAYQAPQGDTETALGALWQELLGVPRVGRLDDFFELGGHSLLVLQLVARVRAAYAIELPVPDVLQHSTLQGLAARLQELRLARFAAADVARHAEELDGMSAEQLRQLLEQEG